MPKILAIDTSCDETSVAVLEGFRVLANLLPSQVSLHSKWGGVVPSLAKLAHQDRIDGVVERALKLSGLKIEEIDIFAVTYGPGLAIALEIGINKAKELAQEFNKPLIAINHMEGHLYSAFAQKSTSNLNSETTEFNYPVLGALISGGHSEFILVNKFGDYKLLGETLDDACGEAYDKCGRLLGLGYPAGPVITKFSKERRKLLKTKKEFNLSFKNDQQSLIAKLSYLEGENIIDYSLPVPMANSKDFNMSYSGLKSAFSRIIENNTLTKDFIMDMCVLFEAVALKQITTKMEKILKTYNVNEIWLGGGVVASPMLKSTVKQISTKKVRFPYAKKLTGDNAAMIGVVAYLKYLNYGLLHNEEKGIFIKRFDSLDRNPSLSLS